MRIVIWNCRGNFYKKHSAILQFHPDLLIVPECEKLPGIQQVFGSSPVTSFHWFGDDPKKGLAVLSYGDYAVVPHPEYDRQYRWVVPILVSQPVSFLLFAVWIMPHRSMRSYAFPLLKAFEHYRSLTEASESVWAGDFNANCMFDEPHTSYKFRDFVRLLRNCGLRSLYHEQRGCDHGNEPEQTFYPHRKAKHGCYMDYVFASGGFPSGTYKVSIGRLSDWGKLSDHMPLVCDFSLQTPTALNHQGE